MKYLITGATGDIGSRVVTRLLQRGERPRVFVRDADKARARFADRVDIAAGDLADAASLREALAGIEALFLVNSGPEIADRDRLAARLANAAGVQRIIKLSTLDAETKVGTGVWHAQGESFIRETGIRSVFVRPSGFMQNALHWAGTIRSHGAVHSSTGDGRIAFIHSDDIADVALQALTRPEFDGEALSITGPEALSYGEMTAKIAATIDKPLRFEPIGEAQVRQNMLARGESQQVISAHLSIYRAIREGRLAIRTDVVTRVLSRPPRTFDQWIGEHASAFH